MKMHAQSTDSAWCSFSCGCVKDPSNMHYQTVDHRFWHSAERDDSKVQPVSLFIPAGCEKPVQDDVEHGDGSRMICNMTGNNWESLPYPIIIDSGAAASVMLAKWCAHINAVETEGSRHGKLYTAANGGKIFEEGEKVVTLMSQEGMMRNMRFTSCDVEKALGSVSAICSQGHTIVFNGPDHPDGSYIYHIESGERIELQHKDGVFVLNNKIAPKSKQMGPFAGQGR